MNKVTQRSIALVKALQVVKLYNYIVYSHLAMGEREGGGAVRGTLAWLEGLVSWMAS